MHLPKPKFLLTSPSQKCHVKLIRTVPNFYLRTVQRNYTKLSASAMLHKNMTSIFWKGSWWLWWNRRIHWGVRAGGLLTPEVSFLLKMHRTTTSLLVEIFPGASKHIPMTLFLLSFYSHLVIKGYVYSSFLKPYNPAKVQKVDAENRLYDDDFDNISLFVSSRPASDVTGTPEGSISDSSSSLSGTCGKFETNGTVVDSFQEVDEQVRIWTLMQKCLAVLLMKDVLSNVVLSYCKTWWKSSALTSRRLALLARTLCAPFGKEFHFLSLFPQMRRGQWFLPCRVDMRIRDNVYMSSTQHRVATQ